jgi:hypothetical protein
MTEVAVPKDLFEKILRLSDGLQPRPAQRRAGTVECVITTEKCVRTTGKGTKSMDRTSLGMLGKEKRRENDETRPSLSGKRAEC